MNNINAIRLEDSLLKALDVNIGARVNVGYFDQICLNPFEHYLQITNSTVDIVFNGNYEVFIADLCGNNLLEITEKVYIEEEQDVNGIRQIAFEIVNIGVDFYNYVILKFRNTVSGQLFYSNPFVVYENEATTLIEYRGVSDFMGFAYSRFNKMQSIRISAYFNNFADERTVDEYVNEVGNKVTNVPIITYNEKYIFEKIDNFGMRWLNCILSHPIVYINGNRMTNTILLKELELKQNSNIGTVDFVANVNYNDKSNHDYQIAETLELISINPLGVYTLSSLPNEIVLTFNQNISLNSGSIILFSGSNGILETFTTGLVNQNTLTIDITGIITELDNYKIIVSENFITSSFGTFEGGIFDFEVTNADYSASDYNTVDYFTN